MGTIEIVEVLLKKFFSRGCQSKKCAGKCTLLKTGKIASPPPPPFNLIFSGVDVCKVVDLVILHRSIRNMRPLFWTMFTLAFARAIADQGVLMPPGLLIGAGYWGMSDTDL